MPTYHQTKDEFQHVLDHQETVSVKKLKRMMGDMNMSLNSSESVEVKFLKGEIRKLNKEISKMKYEQKLAKKNRMRKKGVGMNG